MGKQNWYIIIGSLILTLIVYVLLKALSANVNTYLIIAAFVGAVFAVLLASKFIQLYLFPKSNSKDEVEIKHYAFLHPYELQPANGNIELCFELPESDEVKFYMESERGGLKLDIMSGNLEKGVYPCTFDTKQLSNGVYFYILETSNQRVMKKLAVLNN